MDKLTPPRMGDHPGPWVRDVLLPSVGLPVARAAEAMSVNRSNLHHVLAGSRGLTWEMAFRLEALTGADADMLMMRQHMHDREVAQEGRAEATANITRASARTKINFRGKLMKASDG